MGDVDNLEFANVDETYIWDHETPNYIVCLVFDFDGEIGPRLYCCYKCKNHVSLHDDIISKTFQYRPGACLAANADTKSACRAEHRTWYTQGCPSKTGILAVLLLGLYIICYSPGMGTVPWIMNSEIYPLKYRGIGGGIAAVSNWISNLIVSQPFLTLTHGLGSAGTFFLFARISAVTGTAIFLLVPETKGQTFEEVEKMLEKGFKPSLCGDTNPDKELNGKV